VFVTKEPCPMCSGALLMSRVKRVCYAVPDPEDGLPRRSHQSQRPAARKPSLGTHRRRGA
jgi:tRNA(Arg) A34 adenosine deaminase TadA